MQTSKIQIDLENLKQTTRHAAAAYLHPSVIKIIGWI
jgi:hypothetical protein